MTCWYWHRLLSEVRQGVAHERRSRSEGSRQCRNRVGISQLTNHVRHVRDELWVHEIGERLLPPRGLHDSRVVPLEHRDERRTQLRARVPRSKQPCLLEGRAPLASISPKELLCDRVLVHLGLHACSEEQCCNQRHGLKTSLSSRPH